MEKTDEQVKQKDHLTGWMTDDGLRMCYHCGMFERYRFEFERREGQVLCPHGVRDLEKALAKLPKRDQDFVIRTGQQTLTAFGE